MKLFKRKEKVYKEDCVNHNKERNTCKQNEIVYHVIKKCPKDCSRYIKVERKRKLKFSKA